jgi:hypothetical protein
VLKNFAKRETCKLWAGKVSLFFAACKTTWDTPDDVALFTSCLAFYSAYALLFVPTLNF